MALTAEQIKAQKIEYARDMLKSAKTGSTMPDWEINVNDTWGLSSSITDSLLEAYECRRVTKTKSVTYWHCFLRGYDYEKDKEVMRHLMNFESESALRATIREIRQSSEKLRFKASPVRQTTVDVED